MSALIWKMSWPWRIRAGNRPSCKFSECYGNTNSRTQFLLYLWYIYVYTLKSDIWLQGTPHQEQVLFSFSKSFFVDSCILTVRVCVCVESTIFFALGPLHLAQVRTQAWTLIRQSLSITSAFVFRRRYLSASSWADLKKVLSACLPPSVRFHKSIMMVTKNFSTAFRYFWCF